MFPNLSLIIPNFVFNCFNIIAINFFFENKNFLDLRDNFNILDTIVLFCVSNNILNIDQYFLQYFCKIPNPSYKLFLTYCDEQNLRQSGQVSYVH